jgi:hypothetical protein
VSEAFAGIDRIRELMAMPTEDDEDEARERPCRASAARSSSTT